MANLEHKLLQAQTHADAGRHEQARALYQRILQQHPGHTYTMVQMARTLLALNQRPQAVYYAKAALEGRPDDPELRYHTGRMLALAGELSDAEPVLRSAIAGGFHNPAAYAALAAVLSSLGRYRETSEFCIDALARFPGHTSLAVTGSAAHLARGRVEEAMDLARTAAAAGGDDPAVLSTLAQTMNNARRAEQDEIIAAHTRYGARLKAMAPPELGPLTNNLDPEKKLRIGFISPDLRTHSVAFFVEPILRELDRERFETVCYYTASNSDAMTTRLKSLASRWVDAHALPPLDLAMRMRRDGIDIAIELSGHTHGHRLMAMALRPAPLTITYIGYPNTTGLEGVDVRLVDAITDPPGEADRVVTEKLVRQDPCFQCFGPPTAAGFDAPDPGSPPCEANGFITFGSFNAVQKLNEDVIRAWSGLLGRVPNSRLILKAATLREPALREEIAGRFAAQGLPADRLDLQGPIDDTGGHLAAYRRIDIGLDPFPYNGTTTTCEALWMGVPVVAFRGDRHASRVSASLLSAAGLPELIADSAEGAIDLAAALAADTARIRNYRSAIRERMGASPLCDAPRFAAMFGGTLRGIWRERCAAAR